MTNEQRENYQVCPIFTFTFRWLNDQHEDVEVLESGEVVGLVDRSGRTEMVFPSVAKVARRWAGWEK